ncbi:MAG: hypothetical protein K2L96_02970 [Muribaculaceae bacterium]|nr:hypothetical protein [Muribaculaceae bacterium]
MNEDKNPAVENTNAENSPLTEQPLTAETPAPAPKKSGWLPLLSLVLAVAAWVTLAYSTGYYAMCVAGASIITAIFAVRRKTGAWRNVAITALIASAVLIVVVAAFLIVLKIGLE